MLCVKTRAFAPLCVSLDDLVPAGHFYRHLERTLDLAFVRDLVSEYCVAGGRPSVDPVVFFKLQPCSSSRGCARSASSRESSRTGSACAGTSATTSASACPTTPA